MNKRERARVVKDLREAAEIAADLGVNVVTALAIIQPFDRWAAASRPAYNALLVDGYYQSIKHAPLALLFVAAAVEAGDWP